MSFKSICRSYILCQRCNARFILQIDKWSKYKILLKITAHPIYDKYSFDVPYEILIVSKFLTFLNQLTFSVGLCFVYSNGMVVNSQHFLLSKSFLFIFRNREEVHIFSMTWENSFTFILHQPKFYFVKLHFYVLWFFVYAF